MFRIAAENIYGLGRFVLSQTCIAKHPFKTPSAPTQPTVTRVTADSMTVEWSPGSSDGGSKITAYHIERKERNAILWTKYEFPCKNTEMTWNNLIEVI